MDDTRISIGQGIALPLLILAYPAEPPFPGVDVTVAGTEFALDGSAIETREIGGQLYLDEAFLGRLRPASLRKAEEMGGAENPETPCRERQKIPSGQVLDTLLRDGLEDDRRLHRLWLARLFPVWRKENPYP